MKVQKRKICVVTGTRAEYGLLRPLMHVLQQRGDVQLQLIVCAAHLSPAHGLTVHTVIEDGFAIDAEVDLLLASQTRVSCAKSLALGILGFTDALARLRPDITVILGDRYEMLAVAQVCLLLNLPLAHIHGGEVTEGAFDDAIRHAITKMAHLHFVAAEEFRQRVLQLGESSERTWVVGAPGLQGIRETKFKSREEVAARVGMHLADPYLLVAYHPVTMDVDLGIAGCEELIAALDLVGRFRIIFTLPNADPGNARVTDMMRQYAQHHPGRAVCVESLGHQVFFSAMKHAAAIVGNSSSGIIEAPSVGTPTVNVGDRQKGRPQAASVTSCACDRAAIGRAIDLATTVEFQRTAKTCVNPYERSDPIGSISRILVDIPLATLSTKRFHDQPPLEISP